MKGVQCYELFGGIALKNHAFSFSFFQLERFIYICGSKTAFVCSTDGEAETLSDCNSIAIHCPAKCLLQWTEDNSPMLQNWVVLPKRDMPVGAGQVGVSMQQSEKMI